MIRNVSSPNQLPERFKILKSIEQAKQNYPKSLVYVFTSKHTMLSSGGKPWQIIAVEA